MSFHGGLLADSRGLCRAPSLLAGRGVGKDFARAVRRPDARVPAARHAGAPGMARAGLGHPSSMGDWREHLDGLTLESRLKALLVYELASDRVPGAPLEVATAAVRAVATAEGLDTGQPWIQAAAARISVGPPGA